MSYQTMDHADWLERQNVALNRNRAGRKGCKPLPEKLSEFQAKVIDIVGMIGGGIYNANICSPEKIDWHYGGGVSLTWFQELATWDFDQLSRLVFLCHMARIRCSVSAVAPRTIRLAFWQRKAAGDMAVRHPNLDEAVEAFKQYLPADHRIVYREPEAADEVKE
jgi:hypothetical protein